MSASVRRRAPETNDPTPDAPERERDGLVTVARATRDVLNRAACSEEPLRPREWRVLAAVIQLTSTWTKLTDSVYVAIVAAAAGFDPDSKDDRKVVGQELRSLSERGLIMYRPARGRGSRSMVGIPVPVADVIVTADPAVTPAPAPLEDPVRRTLDKLTLRDVDPDPRTVEQIGRLLERGWTPTKIARHPLVDKTFEGANDVEAVLRARLGRLAEELSPDEAAAAYHRRTEGGTVA